MVSVKHFFRKVLIMDASNKALEYFSSGYNCAESVLLALSAELGYEKDPCLPRIATGFGGGIARNGDICGALAGGMMALGLALGRDDGLGSREPCYPAADKLFNAFVEKFGHSTCRGILGADLKTTDGLKAHTNGEHKPYCNACVEWTTNAAQDIIDEFSQGYSVKA
jgi:C_GCAxxG_C_C family probable redox protein